MQISISGARSSHSLLVSYVEIALRYYDHNSIAGHNECLDESFYNMSDIVILHINEGSSLIFSSTSLLVSKTWKLTIMAGLFK